MYCIWASGTQVDVSPSLPSQLGTVLKCETEHEKLGMLTLPQTNLVPQKGEWGLLLPLFQLNSIQVHITSLISKVLVETVREKITFSEDTSSNEDSIRRE